jgi:preprotein translocase subunit SecG
MSIFVVVIHIIVCLALIMVVLLQTGKGADMGAAFGGGSSNTLFGATGASTFLSKMTTAAAVVFMLTSLILAYMATTQQAGISPLKDQPVVETTTVPPAGEATATPDTTPPAENTATTPETASPAQQQESPRKSDQ